MTITIKPDEPVERLTDAIATGHDILVAASALADSDLAALIATAQLPGVASASPVPVAGVHKPTSYRCHPASPPAPTLALPCPELCVLSGEALRSIGPARVAAASTRGLVRRVSERLLQHGWRHAACAGLAFGWDAADSTGIRPTGAWNANSIASLVGPANAGLEAHMTWASAQLNSLRLVIDGVCVTDSPNTGTQHLVVQVARAMASARPAARVELAVRREFVNPIRDHLAESSVSVIDRRHGIDADVLYRPYQMIYADELPFVAGTGRRTVVGQLDMIGFSNPFYHPSSSLFFFARNLQRHLMRHADSVTFISEFGRSSALAECPDLQHERLHVVSCGTETVSTDVATAPDRANELGMPLIVCLSSTFRHKNRAHAIEIFRHLVENHGFDGDLVLAGPEPFYGASVGDEDAALLALASEVRGRVHRWGHISDGDKRWLLEHAGLVLYPSVVEGFGLVPFEAAAAGVPSLSFAGSAPAELLAGTGALVPTWDPLDWARRANELLVSPDASRRVVASVLTASHVLSWERCAQLTWEAVDTALAMVRRSESNDDGGALPQISPRRRASRTAGLRFQISRITPGLRRRATAELGKLSGRRPYSAARDS